MHALSQLRLQNFPHRVARDDVKVLNMLGQLVDRHANLFQVVNDIFQRRQPGLVLGHDVDTGLLAHDFVGHRGGHIGVDRDHLIGRARMERYIEDFVLHSPVLDIPQEQLTRRDRAQFAWAQVSDIFRRVWLYVLIGVGIGAAIHNWIPADWIEALLGQNNWWSVPLATLLGVPMYADIFGTLPIAEALVAKGVGLGTVLAFMMAVTALSLPSLIMLKRVVKARLLATFFAIVVSGIVVIGLLFNATAFLFT